MANMPASSTYKKIQATVRMREIMAAQSRRLALASREGKPKIAWCSSMGPAELLLSLGFLVYSPENHAALLGVTRSANRYIPAANAVGYSPEICSYLTSDIGAYIKKETPLAGAYENMSAVPRPDVLVYNTNQCRDIQDWFSWYSRELRVPALGIATHRNIGAITEDHLQDIAGQMRSLVPSLEGISGAKFDIDKLRSVLSLSRKCTELWEQVLEANVAVPAPLSFFDAVVHMGPAVILRGSEDAVAYYEILLREMKSRTARRDGAVEGERLRVYWEGMPVWGRLKDLAEFFIRLKTAVAASTYCNSWIFNWLSPSDDPFLSLARAYTDIFIVREESIKEDIIEKMVKKYGLHGVLFHDARTCPYNSNNRYGLPERLQRRLGVPTMTINGDLNDLRCYSEEQTKTKIEAFVEQLASYPPAGHG